MEDDSLQSLLLVEGMKSVVATVSGYKGSDRFNLIKLISRSGAAYVGTMSSSITHLVCWKFEGRKYEIARKLNIIVVNHRWIEYCIRSRSRIPEDPYTFHSGADVGPLCLVINQTIAPSKSQKKKFKEPVIDIEHEDTAWADEDLFLQPKPRHNRHNPNRLAVKTIKRNSSKDNPSSSRHCVEDVAEAIDLEVEELKHSNTPRKSNHASPETHRKRRRLVKTHGSWDDTEISNMNQEHQLVDVLPEDNSRGTLPESSDFERQENTADRHALERRRCVNGQNNNDALNDVEEIEDVNDEYLSEFVHHASSIPRNSKECHKAASEDFIHIDFCDKPTASNKLSCVICLTDFSSTRGVLPCGHRFCFECIQTWAKELAAARKSSTCPLCKASFICITKVEDALSSDQKIYSQTIPLDSTNMDVYILPDEVTAPPANVSAQVCFHCSSREPEDLLVRCNFCENRCVHVFCLDPPLLPWTCDYCQDLQMIYHYNR